MYAFSIHYRSVPAEVRGKYAFPPDRRAELSKSLADAGFPCHVILCTCNRTELYISGDTPCTDPVLTLLSQYAGTSRAALAEYIRSYHADSAYRHLFRTACGTDSMILGEDEILRQVRMAYDEATAQHTADWEINWAFQGAVACAKRIKTDTGLSSTPVSAATIAANEAAHFAEHVSVLMIGAGGQIGGSVLKNLVAHKNVSVTVTVRSGRAIEVPNGVKTVPYHDRYDFADAADCIISATASPHFTLTAERLSAALQTDKPRLLIDLAVPPDIDPEAANLRGIRHVNIDGFERLAAENRSLRADMAQQAEAIIAEEIDTLKKKLIYRTMLDDLPQFFQYLREKDPIRLVYLMKAQTDAHSFAQFAEVVQKIAREEG